MYVYALQADVAGGILMMRAPAGRGLVAIGNAAGQLVLTDPRAGSLPTLLGLTAACSEPSSSRHPCDTCCLQSVRRVDAADAFCCVN